MRPSLSPLLLAALLAPAGACGGDGSCAQCGDPQAKGTLANAELIETSGVAASARHADVLYAHNDSGDSSRFFAVSLAGADLGTFRVKNAQNVDWEDMAVGPCDAGSCIYIADTGDNALDRLAYTLYRIAEPAVLPGGELEVASERFEFTYPDGPHDAETMLVHPETGVVTIVTKVDDGPATIYELPPLQTGATLMAVARGELAPSHGDNEFTGGAIRPDAAGILMRTHSDLFYYPMQPGRSVAEALAQDGCRLPAPDEMRGEAVTWLTGGALATVGEGVGAPVHVTSCDL